MIETPAPPLWPEDSNVNTRSGPGNVGFLTGMVFTTLVGLETVS